MSSKGVLSRDEFLPFHFDRRKEETLKSMYIDRFNRVPFSIPLSLVGWSCLLAVLPGRFRVLWLI